MKHFKNLKSSTAIEKDTPELNEILQCPITSELMEDALIVNSGQSYSSRGLSQLEETWKNACKKYELDVLQNPNLKNPEFICPQTRKPITKFIKILP